ncbi:MAG: chemotaxis protein CheB, partial [Bacillota bacterium]
MKQNKKDKNNKTESGNTQKNIEKKEKTKGKKSAEDDCADFPIVGIGASAGGLEAFKEFFSGIPDDTEPGMAFVLIQHLAPDHKSSLTD